MPYDRWLPYDHWLRSVGAAASGVVIAAAILYLACLAIRLTIAPYG